MKSLTGPGTGSPFLVQSLAILKASLSKLSAAVGSFFASKFIESCLLRLRDDPDDRAYLPPGECLSTQFLYPTVQVYPNSPGAVRPPPFLVTFFIQRSTLVT